MTLGTLLLLILTLYLTLIAYGVVGACRRLTGKPLLAAEALLVLLLPALLTLALWALGEDDLIAQWSRLFIAMPIVGAAVAVLADRVARRTGS